MKQAGAAPLLLPRDLRVTLSAASIGFFFLRVFCLRLRLVYLCVCVCVYILGLFACV